MALRARMADIDGVCAVADADDGEHAIIDIGSNTVRLVIYGGPVRAPTVLYNEKVTARLGKGVADNGKLGPKGRAAALSALGRYAAILALRGITDVQTVATAAARDASNGAAFLDDVRALGLSPRLLSGEEEALTSAHGVAAGFPGARGVVGDLGGGSLELIDIDGPNCTHGVSLPLGTLRLPALRQGGAGDFAKRVRKMLRGADWSGAHDQPFYLVGGSFRALARVAMVRMGWPIDDPHGFELTAAEALTLSRSVAAMHPAGRKLDKGADKNAPTPTVSKVLDPQILGVSSARMVSLPDAAALLGVLVRELKPSKLVFSGWGLREGLLAERFDAATRAQNPMLAGVTAFADAQVPGLAATARLVAAWTAPVCSGIGGAQHGDADLRLAATLLALASMRTEPNLRVEQAGKWALRKRWIGIDAQGRAMLTLAVMANSGRTAISDELLRLAPMAAAREAVVWGLATRLARRFTGTSSAALAGSSLAVVGTQLVLTVRGDMAALYSDAVGKDLRVLAEWLGLTPCFQATIASGALASGALSPN